MVLVIAEFVGGAALGAFLGSLLEVVRKEVGKPTQFQPLYQNLEYSLRVLKQMTEKIEEENKNLGLKDDEILHILDEINKGKELIQKMSVEGRCSPFVALFCCYTDQLIKLDQHLKTLLNILIVGGVGDGKKVLFLAQEHQKELASVKKAIGDFSTVIDDLSTVTTESKSTLNEIQQQQKDDADDASALLKFARGNKDALTEIELTQKDQILKMTGLAEDAKSMMKVTRDNNAVLDEICLTQQHQIVEMAELEEAAKSVMKQMKCCVCYASKGGSVNKKKRGIFKVKRKGRALTPQISNMHVFSQADVEKITNNFNPERRCGISTVMYTGDVYELPVVVKKFEPQYGSEFRTKPLLDELCLLGQIWHPNIVMILGYSFDISYSTIIYEFVPNGNLREWLCRGAIGFDHSWNNRVRIALGLCEAFAFLHKNRLVVRDINTSNVLLDEDFNPKLSGLHRLMCISDSGDEEDRRLGLLVKNDIRSLIAVLRQIFSVPLNDGELVPQTTFGYLDNQPPIVELIKLFKTLTLNQDHPSLNASP